MIRQKFTPPTCTLEITANTSPLSQWAQRPVLQNLQFNLYFDAPQLPEEMHISIQGDRIQLEALYEAVSTYVQSFLLQSHSESFELLTKSQEYDVSNNSIHETAEEAIPTMRSASPEAGLMWQKDSLPEKTSASLRAVEKGENPIKFGAERIYLQPKGLLSHELFLGSLANEQSGPVVNLGMLQLFDLASALEEYSNAVMALPNLKSPVTVFKWPEWAKTAAVVVLTAGVTAAVTTNLNRSPSVQTATRQSVDTPSATLGKKNTNQPQPIVVAPAPQLPPPPPPQTPPEKLPKLPPLGANPMQPLATAVPGQAPLSNPNTPAAGSVGIEIPPPPNSTLPSIPPAPPVVTIPNLPPPAPTVAPDIASSTGVTTPSATTPPAPTPAPSTAQQNRSNEAVNGPQGGSTPPAPAAPKIGELPPELPIVDLPEKGPENGPVAAVPPQTSSSQPENNQTAKPETSAVSDINVQIDQAKDYFQQRWKPPASLTQPLEYTLALNADGSIRQILPRGLTSGRMIDITGMPLANEPFVSPIEGGEPPRIRVVLRPDGRVQTFLEPFKNDF